LDQTSGTALGSTEEPEPRGHDRKIVFPSPGEFSPALHIGARSTTTASGQTSSSGVGSGGVSPYLSVSARPALETTNLIGTLFLQDVVSRPPPFSSRLFRPPRFSL
jgi:hypothetical protein